MSELARLLKSPIPFSWDFCVFYHLRSANLMHLKLAGTCTPACWHPHPPGATGNVRWKAGSWEHPWWMESAESDIWPWTFLLQTDTSAWFILSFSHFPPGHETSFGFTSKWVFDFTGDQEFNPCPDCSALSPSIQRILTFPNSPTSKSCPGSWQQKSNDLINTKHGVAMEGAFLVRKISSFLSVNES